MDIVILGGGVVGLTLANLLTQNTNLKLALIDAHQPELQWDPEGYDLRCSAIVAASQQVFCAIGVWQTLLNDRFGVYEQMLVWDREPHVKLEFNASSINAENLGYIIENRVLVRALYNQLLQHPNVEFICGTVTQLEFSTHKVALTVNAQNINCQLLIGADGANSLVRRAAEIATTGWDYQHSALVATIKSQVPHKHIARQRFMPDGPLAFLPLDAENLSSIVWSTNPVKSDALMAMQPDEFCQHLAQEFAFCLGDLELHGERKNFPLRMLHAEQYVKPRVALVGDAAHVIHPLAGQGLNLGIKDAAVLAQVLQEAHLRGADLGKLSILRKYERSRKGHNISVLALMESIKRGFALENSASVNLRYGGIYCINSINFLKNTMMRFAAGV